MVKSPTKNQRLKKLKLDIKEIFVLMRMILFNIVIILVICERSWLSLHLASCIYYFSLANSVLLLKEELYPKANQQSILFFLVKLDSKSNDSNNHFCGLAVITGKSF